MSDNAEEAMEVTMYDKSMSKIVATSTQGEGLYLIRRADGLAQVANTNRGRLLPPWSAGFLLRQWRLASS